MWKSRRLLTLLGVGVAAGFAALVLPMSVANAAGESGSTSPVPGWDGPYETCEGVVCLVMEPLTRESVGRDWSYEGIRPWITDWKGDQLYNVELNGEAVGGYNIKIEDFWNSFYSTSAYQFGDFMPNSDTPEDLSVLGNFGYLSGASIYQINLFDGAFTNLTINGVGPHDLNYWVMSANDLTYSVVTDPLKGVSAGLIQFGDDAPMQLWNSLFHSWTPEIPEYLIPNDPFAALDFNPCDFLGLCDLVG